MGSTPIRGTKLEGPDDTSFIRVNLVGGGITWINWRTVTLPELKGHNDFIVFPEYPGLLILNDGILTDIWNLRNPYIFDEW